MKVYRKPTLVKMQVLSSITAVAGGGSNGRGEVL